MTIIDRYSADKLGQSNLTVLDARNIMDDLNGSAEWVDKAPVADATHIPQQPWMFSDSGMNGGRHPIPVQEIIDTLFYAFKGDENRIVIFADDDSFFHARLYYLFKLYGHETYLWNDTISQLEAALKDKNIQTLPLPEASPVNLQSRINSAFHCSMKDVQSAISSPRTLLIDVRSRPRYLGCEEPADDKMGHIPGSINIPYPSIYKNGAIDFSALDHMNAEFAKFDEIVVYCGSGMSASSMFVLLHAGGFPVKLYGGSFSEWITDPGNTVETGDSRLNERVSSIYG
ncbi:sulfurtransferase [Salinicoccus albus]|uniref:sulfurtransferase n=1 Tax=Salinicoccus albus TaxID=418756 RepID=UPI0003718A1C|nr:rhodanese-like domain-containing protein [Salinicoccus albus]